MANQIFDISRRLEPETAVWPGDTPFKLSEVMNLAGGDSVNLTTITMSAHTGSHADAPYHFSVRGLTMEAVDLRPYWGLAQVVTVNKVNGPLYPDDFAAYNLQQTPRLLVRTPISEISERRFPEQIPYPSPELADYLGSLNLLLYGTDAPSMDAIDDPQLPGHQALLRNGIAILEFLNLSQVTDGLYELSALPLKIVGGDGSPVRAALKSLE